MSQNKQRLLLVCVGMLAASMSGCALLQVPFQLAGGILQVVGTVVKGAFDLAKSLPMPPPGVF